MKSILIGAFALLCIANHAAAQSTLTVGPNGSYLDTLQFDGAYNDGQGGGFNGNAVFRMTPYFKDNAAGPRTVGMFCNPQFGPLATEQDKTAYYSCYNMQMGTASNPIPNWINGVPTGYQANITTNQTLSNMAGAADGAMGFGTTITTLAGAPFVGHATAINVKNAVSNGYGYNLDIENEANGGTLIGYNAQASIGTGTRYPATTAFRVAGKWATGIDLGGHSAVGTTMMVFATINGTANPYAIDGSGTDTFRIYGGGTSGGMILYGSEFTSQGGLIRFRDNPYQGFQGASIDTATGSVAASAIILKAPNGSCWKMTVSNSGALTTASTACQN